MEVLEQKLKEFAREMIAKMEKVAHKHGGADSPRNVTNDGFDWRSNEVASAVHCHLIKEFAEYIIADDKNLPKEKRKEELVDIANCAMILACMIDEGAY